jgi:hypothetical protein
VVADEYLELCEALPQIDVLFSRYPICYEVISYVVTHSLLVSSLFDHFVFLKFLHAWVPSQCSFAVIRSIQNSQCNIAHFNKYFKKRREFMMPY